jgi:hypothetical protein
MLKSEYIAHKFLTPMTVKADRIMNGPGSFAFRLAALNALDTNKGRVWK